MRPVLNILAIRIPTGDVYRLRDGEFLNDSVIAFYLSYLHREVRVPCFSPKLMSFVFLCRALSHN